MGTIKILLQRATNLDTLDLYDQRPYCIMDYGTQKVKSKPCTTNAKDPVWETAYKFSVSSDNPKSTMTISIKDETSKKLIGTATADLSTALSRGKDELVLPVMTPDSFQQGFLNLKVRYSASSSEPRSGSSKSKQAIPRSDSNASSTTNQSQSNVLRTPTRDQDSKTRNPSSSSFDLDYINTTLSSDFDTNYTTTQAPVRPSSGSSGSTKQSAAAQPLSWAASAASAAASAVAAVLPKTTSINSSADVSLNKLPSTEDSKMVQDLLDQNTNLNKELKSLKVAFEEQGTLLKARNKELEDLHDLLDKTENEKVAALRASKEHSANDPFGPHKFKALEDENVGLQHKLVLVERERRESEEHLQSMQQRNKTLLEEVNQLKLNLQNTAAELQQARSNERFLTQEKEQLQSSVRGIEDGSQSKFQKVVDQLEDTQRTVISLNTEKQRLARELNDAKAALGAAQSKNEEHDYLQQQLRDAWSKNLDLQNRIRQLEAASSTKSEKQAAAAAAVVADNNQHAASMAAELLSENEFLKKSLIMAKLELAQAKEQNDVAQRNLFRMTSNVGRVGA